LLGSPAASFSSTEFGCIVAPVTEYVERLEKRLRSARWLRNIHLAASVAVPTLISGVFAYQDRFDATARAQVKSVSAEVIVLDPAGTQTSGTVVQYEFAGSVRRGLLLEPNVPKVSGARLSVNVRTDTGELLGTTGSAPDDATPDWRFRAFALFCGFLPFAVMSANYESRRRSIGRNLRLRAKVPDPL